MTTIEDFFKDSKERDTRTDRLKAFCAGCKLCHLQEDGLRHIGDETYTKYWVLVSAVPEPLGEVETEVLGMMVRSFRKGSIDEALASQTKEIELPIFGDPVSWAAWETNTLRYLLCIYAIYIDKSRYPLLTQEQKGRLLLDRVIKARFKEGVK